MAYVGFQPCGCHAMGMGMDLGDDDADTGRDLLDLLRSGATLRYVTLDEARAVPLDDDCGKRPGPSAGTSHGA